MARWKKLSRTSQVYNGRCDIIVERHQTGWVSWAFMGDDRRYHGRADTVAGAKSAALRACKGKR